MGQEALLSSTGIIVAQYGRSELTSRCIASLRRSHPGVRILVVDDGSPAVRDRRELQSARWRNVSVLSLGENCGVTHAWNAGAKLLIQRANPSRLVFLNNDVITCGPWLPQLLAPLSEQANVLTGPRLRGERHLPARLVEQLPVARFLEGWCLALRTDTFLAAGGFDSTMRLYFSDTDLQCRLLAEPLLKLQVVSGLPLVHQSHQSTQTRSARSSQWHRDRARFIAKWQRC